MIVRMVCFTYDNICMCVYIYITHIHRHTVIIYAIVKNWHVNAYNLSYQCSEHVINWIKFLMGTSIISPLIFHHTQYQWKLFRAVVRCAPIVKHGIKSIFEKRKQMLRFFLRVTQSGGGSQRDHYNFIQWLVYCVNHRLSSFWQKQAADSFNNSQAITRTSCKSKWISYRFLINSHCSRF